MLLKSGLCKLEYSSLVNLSNSLPEGQVNFLIFISP